MAVIPTLCYLLTTLPSWRILPLPACRIPCAKTYSITKPICLCLCRNHIAFAPTLLARNFNHTAAPIGILATSLVRGSALSATGLLFLEHAQLDARNRFAAHKAGLVRILTLRGSRRIVFRHGCLSTRRLCRVRQARPTPARTRLFYRLLTQMPCQFALFLRLLQVAPFGS